MLEIKKNYKKNYRSIFISKFCFKHSKGILKKNIIKYYLIIKKKTKKKVLFFFIILVLMVGKLPKIFKSNKNSRTKQYEFLGFEYKIDLFKVFKFINIYLPITDIVENLYFKFSQAEYRLTIKHFPILNELDKAYESNPTLVDYIQDYKLILKIKTFINDWYISECVIRSIGIPIVSSNRF
jgi:hypothetical protein